MGNSRLSLDGCNTRCNFKSAFANRIRGYTDKDRLCGLVLRESL